MLVKFGDDGGRGKCRAKYVRKCLIEKLCNAKAFKNSVTFND